MSRTKAFFYNSLLAAILQAVSMLVGFVLPRVMLSAYGSEINGLVSSVTQFISYFNLVEAGLSSAAIYALYKPLADENHKEINGVVSVAKKFYTQAGYIFVSLTLGLSLLYPYYIRTSALNPLGVGMLILILGGNGALEFFTLSKYRVLLTADQKAYVISAASIIQMIVNVVLTVLMASWHASIILLRLVTLLTIFLRSAILMIYCKNKYAYLNYKETPNSAALSKRWDALYLQILGAIHSGAPVLIITLILKDLTLVSVYTIFNMVVGGVGGIVGIFTGGLAASFGDIIARKEIKTLQRSYQEFEFLYYATITIIFSITFITIMPFIDIYTYDILDANYNLPVVGFLFVLNGLLYNIKTPQGMLVMSAGMYRETRLQTTIQGTIAVIAGIILAPAFGIAGVLMGSILSNLYRDIDLMVFVPHHITFLPAKCTFWRIVRIASCVSISCIPFLFLNYTPLTFFAWCVFAIVVTLYVVTVVLVISLLFERKEIKNIIKRLRNLVKK